MKTSADTHPDYARRFDVVKQQQLRKAGSVHNSLASTVKSGVKSFGTRVVTGAWAYDEAFGR